MTTCDHCTGLACGDECDGKSHATKDKGPCNQCSIMGKDCAHCGPPSWEGFIPMNGIMPLDMIAPTERTCEMCGGKGYTAEHSPALNDHDGEGNCLGACPVQVQCEHCNGTGTEPRPAAQDADELKKAFERWENGELNDFDMDFADSICDVNSETDKWNRAYAFYAGNRNRRPSRPMSAEVEKAIRQLGLFLHYEGTAIDSITAIRDFDLIVAALKARV